MDTLKDILGKIYEEKEKTNKNVEQLYSESGFPEKLTDEEIQLLKENDVEVTEDYYNIDFEHEPDIYGYMGYITDAVILSLRKMGYTIYKAECPVVKFNGKLIQLKTFELTNLSTLEIMKEIAEYIDKNSTDKSAIIFSVLIKFFITEDNNGKFESIKETPLVRIHTL